MGPTLGDHRLIRHRPSVPSPTTRPPLPPTSDRSEATSSWGEGGGLDVAARKTHIRIWRMITESYSRSPPAAPNPIIAAARPGPADWETHRATRGPRTGDRRARTQTGTATSPARHQTPIPAETAVSHGISYRQLQLRWPATQRHRRSSPSVWSSSPEYPAPFLQTPSIPRACKRCELPAYCPPHLYFTGHSNSSNCSVH